MSNSLAQELEYQVSSSIKLMLTLEPVIMKKKYFLFCTSLSLMAFNLGFSQDQLKNDYAPVAAELQKWDPVRGEWLSNSIYAIANNQAIPDRTFPEDFTPYEMMTVVPMVHKEAIRSIAGTQRNNARTNPNNASNDQFWTFVSDFFIRPTCQTVSGRSYGDPHFKSFDGNGFSLQSVGELILAKSKNGLFELQARQKASGNDFSLNSAVAMNVAGDRFCVYTDDLPDSDMSTPFRLNGRPVHITDATYYLPHGGTVRHKGREYTITWPTGEKVTLQTSGAGNFGNFGFMNITTLIYPCVMGGYEGVLGNANGIPNDDLRTPDNSSNHAELFASMNQFGNMMGNNNDAERQYQERITREFGNYWRVTNANTLFDYSIGNSTASFTDYHFPMIHRTIGDLNTAQRTSSQRNCEAMGLTGYELNACIYDNAYLNIPPSPRPVVTDHTDGVILTSVGRDQKPNVNPTPDPTSPVSKPVHELLIKDNGNTSPVKPAPKPVLLEDKKPPVSSSPAPQTIEKPTTSTSEKINNAVFGTGSSSNSGSSSSPVYKPSSPAPTTSPAPVYKPSSPAPSTSPAPKVQEPVKVNTPAPTPAPVSPAKKGGK